MAANKGNKYAQQWTFENALPRFEDALEHAETSDDCLSLQDAIYYSAIPYSTFDYLADNHEVLGRIKEDIKKEITRRINRLALDKIQPVSATAAIWRMKQLGERDEQHLHTTGTTKTEITVSSQQAKEDIDSLKSKFDEEN